MNKVDCSMSRLSIVHYWITVKITCIAKDFYSSFRYLEIQVSERFSEQVEGK